MQLVFLSYNIRHCRGIDNKVSPTAAASAIAQTGADVAGLQEVDSMNPRSCFINQARRLGKKLGMYSVFGPAVTGLKLIGFGNAVLSRYPVLGKQNFPLPRQGEKRSLLRTEICAAGQRFVFYTTHLGLDQKERLRQVHRILEVTGADRLPLVLAGDFNALPDAPEIRLLCKVFSTGDPAGACPTFPSQSPEHKIDYIFFSNHWQLVEHRVYDSRASDHLPLAVKLVLL